jgi:hypothetical protein
VNVGVVVGAEVDDVIPDNSGSDRRIGPVTSALCFALSKRRVVDVTALLSDAVQWLRVEMKLRAWFWSTIGTVHTFTTRSPR